MRIRRYARIGLSAALVAAIAGSFAPPQPETLPEPPTDPTTLVLQLHEWRSMIPAGIQSMAEFTLYGGGRVITKPSLDSPALEFTLPQWQYRQLYRLAHAAGLDKATDYDDPQVHTDASLLVATLWTPTGLRTTNVPAPSDGSGGARGRVVAFRRLVRQLAPPPANAPRYQPSHIATVVIGGWSAKGDDARAWPGPDPLAGQKTSLGTCTVYEAQALPDTAGAGTTWLVNGEELTIVLLPLLPHERDCFYLDARVP